MTNARLLAIYLNDHLAGATAAIELTRRTLAENAGTELGVFVGELLQEIEEDRDTLLALMSSLGVERSTVKVAVAWATEKVGRLKLNGQLRGYSPLSRLSSSRGSPWVSTASGPSGWHSAS